MTVLDHGAAFAAATELDRDQSRRELGLDPAEHVFLCIGFLQEHKGYDVAVEAFGQSGISSAASLHIVGSVRVDHPDLVAYARRLRRLCGATPGAELHQRFVSDEEFDRWIAAADTVVLPYREIWSSGVLERAKLFDRQIIATDVGGMGDQAPEGTLFFTDTATLVKAMRHCVGDRAVGPDGAVDGGAVLADHDVEPAPWDIDRDRPDRASIEAQIRRRVRHHHLPHDAAGPAIDPLLAIGSLQRHHAVSARPGVTLAKRVLRRLLNWELDPVVTHVERLQQATIESIAELESRFGDSQTTERPADRD